MLFDYIYQEGCEFEFWNSFYFSSLSKVRYNSNDIDVLSGKIKA